MEPQIRAYNHLEKLLHKDVIALITSKKYESLTADQCLIVFARIYSAFVLNDLVIKNKIQTVKKKQK